jgi:short-subunit dehydrogenase
MNEIRQQKVLLLGGTSGIGVAVASELAKNGAQIHLLGRNIVELERTAADLSLRHSCPVTFGEFVADAFETHAKCFSQAADTLGNIDVVVVSIGELGDQKQAEKDFNQAQRIIDSNYTGVVSFLSQAANYLEAKGSGTIIGISSVAGDRGRKSNYTYGSAKAALSAYLQGMRARLCKSGVHVLTVKPGFVDTKMSFGKPGMFLVASPESVAKVIIKAANKKQDVIYVPWFWFWIMLIIRCIPETIFKRLKL